MNAMERKKAAQDFAKTWAGDYKEDGHTAPFWLSLLRDVYGIQHPERYIFFEDAVKHSEKDNSIFIDAQIPEVKVLIEQKATNIPLDKPYERHRNKYESVYEQAEEYDQTKGRNDRARYIITCNFHEFWIYDMSLPEAQRKPIKLALKDLPKHYDQLDFLVDKNSKPSAEEEVKVSVQAGELVGKLYDAFEEVYKQYGDMTEKDMHALNVLCVRIVFCLYAEDSGLFGAPDAFCRYLETFENPANAQAGLRDLFKILDTKLEDRPRFLDKRLAAFPYVNGGLFHDDTVEIPPINDKIYHTIVDDMSKGFDWSVISPTIFGAVFESTLNPETRRKGGMHYTSIQNIHKVIDPLFLDDLKEEFHKIISIPDADKFVARRKETTLRSDYRQRLIDFQNKLANLNFLDPACGSGNFLTETFICLRRLENQVIQELTGGQMLLDVVDPVKVSIKQFYGIEINDFAVTVAKTALWIAESQMLQETEEIISRDIDFLPLKTNAYIQEGNALRMNWNDVIPANKLFRVMGNPPFSGARIMSSQQKADVEFVFGAKWKGIGDLDYVACWYKKAIDYISMTSVQCAFVSTNSITQGIQVPILWKRLFDKGCKFQFAYRTFIWDSEANEKAHVHCVIIGFSLVQPNKQRIIYDKDTKVNAYNINAYLLNAPDIFIEKRNAPISKVPSLVLGGQAIDGGFLTLTEKEKDNLLSKEPDAYKFIRHYMMGKDFIDRCPRYCIWLKGANPSEIKKFPIIVDRIAKVREFRLKSKRKSTYEAAKKPTLFASIVDYNTSYIAIPKVSSQNRRYIPIDYLTSDVIPGDKLFTLGTASLFYFGVLTSNVHMAWVRAFSGRLKSDYSYSNTVVYNNFPWPTSAQKERIEKAAQGILDARRLYPNASFADLYDPLLMPPELQKAHMENDKAVMDAYGFNWHIMKEEDCVAELMKMYQRLVDAEEAKKHG